MGLSGSRINLPGNHIDVSEIHITTLETYITILRNGIRCMHGVEGTLNAANGGSVFIRVKKQSSRDMRFVPG